MPRIPTYEAQQGVLADTGVTPPGPDAFPLIQLGSDASAIAQRLAENQRIAKEQSDNAWVTKSTAQLRSDTLKGYLDGQQKAAADGSGFVDSQVKGFTDSEQTYLSGAPSPEAAAAFQVHASEIHDNLLQDSMTYEASLRGTAVKNAQIDALSLNSATVRKDPNQFQPVLAEALTGISKLAIPANLKVQLAENTKATLAISAINAGIDANPGATKQSILDGKWAPFISPADSESLLNNADTEIKRRQAEADRIARENEAQAAGVARFKIGNEQAAAERGESTGLVSDTDWKLAYGNTWQLAKSETAKTQNAAIAANGMALQPVADWQGIVDKAAPPPTAGNYKADEGLREGMQSAAVKLQNELATDGAANYVDNHSPDFHKALFGAANPDQMTQAVNLGLALQTHMGIPADQQKILPDAYAKSVVDQFARAPDQAARFIESQAQLFGTNWPRVAGELIKAGLPPEAQAFVTADGPGQVMFRIKLAEGLKTGKKTLVDSLPGTTAKDVTDGIAEALQPLTATLPAAASANIVQSATLAGLAMARNGDATGAVKMASDAFLQNYTIIGSGSAAYRVPVNYSGPAVDSGLHALVANLKPADVDALGSITDPSLTDDFRRQQLLNAVRGDPHFQTNADESGVTLLDPNLQPVTKNGKPIVFRFDDALKVAPVRKIGARGYVPAATVGQP